MRKYLYLASVAGGALCATLLASTAFADSGAVLTVGAVGGTNVAVGDTVAASLASGTTATFYSTTNGTSGVKCTASTLSSTVTANPPAPGVATETVDAQTFSGCTSNIVGTTGVRSVTLNNLPYSVSVDGTTGAVAVAPGSAGPIQATVVISTILGTVTCVYQPVAGSLAGAADNTTNSIKFANQQFNKITGSVLCLSTAYWTAAYAPVSDTTQGGPVFVNATAPDPEPTDTATPEPTDTATPEPTDTATPEPTDTATPEPTDPTPTTDPTPSETPVV
ncbi:Tat pathway signal sequence domain protein [Paractinoplanes toevensis]|uniref:Tat pathway signal sequence domain protein n=1 Tax=Paractinoplanes toevensis TaxID=571911 RepID=A0A919W1Y3_9ACTN|nr:Tat pathway signal sequence domain protein [Actinoplanes toevensis]GIM88925.1 hypothetical protein Ato02nite_007180 [Actinoplanes toevensis]